MKLINSDFFRVISAIADLLTLASLLYAFIYGLLNKNKTVTGFFIASFIANAFKTSLLIFVLTLLFKLCEVFYLFPLALFKESTNPYYWEEGHEISHMAAYFIFLVCFMTISWIVASVIWTGSFNYTKILLNHFLPKNKQLPIHHFKLLTIISAKYGANESFVDITDKIKKMIQGNILIISATNEIVGDPIVGVVKKMILTYHYDNDTPVTIEIPENQSRTIKPE